MAEHYKPSGKFSPIAFIYFIIGSLTLLPLLGLAYAYALWYIPFIYLNMIIAAVFAFGAAAVITWLVVKLGKVRNPMLALVFGLLGGVVVMYFHYAAWVDLVINAGERYGSSRLGVTVSNVKLVQVYQLAADPQSLFSLIGEINETGTWTLKGSPVNGIFLTIIWAIEFIGVLAVTTLVSRSAARKPFCEIENKWFEVKKLPELNFIYDKDQLLADLEKGNTAAIDALEKAADAKKHDHSVFKLYSSNNNESYLTIDNKTAKTNSKGEITFTSKELTEYMAVSPSVSKKLLEKQG